MLDSEKLDDFARANQVMAEKPVFPDGKMDYDQILTRSPLPFLPLIGFDPANLREMLNEAVALSNMFVPHREDYSSGWRSLTLHGLAPEKTEGMERYGLDPNDLRQYRWMDFTKTETPCIRDFFETHFGYEFYHRVRIMLLEPGGYILPHSDMRSFLLDPVNIALNQPEGCHFYFERFGQVPFQDFPFIKLSLERKHMVVNQSKVPRFHIIVHGRPNKLRWAPIVEKSYLELKLRYA